MKFAFDNIFYVYNSDRSIHFLLENKKKKENDDLNWQPKKRRACYYY